MPCASDDTLARLLDGGLAEGDRLALERHCGECAACAAVFGELGASGATPPADGVVGRTIGRYRVVRALGEGGMGRVYEAVHEELGTRVALKVMAEQHAHDAELVKRFVTEARAASAVRHERIARVIDLLRTDGGRAVIVMDLVEGKTLRAHERAGWLKSDMVVQVMIDVLDGLAAAHAMGITHRDLKPDNIVVEPSGRAKVLDFGIAKLANAAAETVARTRTGAAIGTPEYMAPEQISGTEADARTDVYAAGVVLYEALAGERPFRGATDFELMRAHLEAPVPRLRDARSDVPAGIAAVVTRALAKAPADRFADAAEMADALAAASGGVERTTAMRAERASARVIEPVTAATERPPARGRARRRKRVVLAFVALAGVGFVGGAVWKLARSSKSASEGERAAAAPPAPPPAVPSIDNAAAAHPDAPAPTWELPPDLLAAANEIASAMPPPSKPPAVRETPPPGKAAAPRGDGQRETSNERFAPIDADIAPNEAPRRKPSPAPATTAKADDPSAPLDPSCRCIANDDALRWAGAALCTVHSRPPRCRCMPASRTSPSPLCPSKLELCTDDCSDFAVWISGKKWRCAEGQPGHFWAVAQELGNCDGYNRPDQTDPLSGMWECSVCERFDSWRHTPGAACRGDHWTGVPLEGHIVCDPRKYR